MARRAFLVSISLVAATLPLEANAQTQSAQATVALEEIVVTSRKREESLLEIPIAVTAFSSADLEAKGITQFRDLTDFTPSFYFSEHGVGRADRSNRILVMRGMRIVAENDHQQAATVFIDGAPMLGSVISGLEDAERIEIVKGPQSAYFGRATFAGAVNFITKTPSEEFKGRATGEFGRFNTIDVGLQLEGPLVQDRLSYRVVASQYNADGHYRNAGPGNKRLGDRKSTNLAGSLYATPNDQFRAKLRLHYFHDDDGPGAAVGYGRGNGEQYYNCRPPGSTLIPLNGTNQWICGEAPFPTKAQIQGDFVVENDIQRLLAGTADPGFILDSAFKPAFIDHYGLERRAWQASLVMDYDFADGFNIQSISAYHSNEWQALDDLDRRATDILPGEREDTAILNSRDLKDNSQELRVTSPSDGRLKWLAGASYFHFDGVRTSGFKLTGNIRSTGVGSIFKGETYGAFGSVSYDVTDQLTASVEARRQWDKITQELTNGQQSQTGTFKSFTPRVIIDFKPTDRSTFYASYAKGTRPGSFNPILLAQPASVLSQIEKEVGYALTVPEEKLDNYEIGFKGRFFDDRAQIVAAVYKGDWDAQTNRVVTVTQPNGTISLISIDAAGGKIKLKGFEVELDVAATENLTFEGSFSVNDSDLKVWDCSDCVFLLGRRNISGEGKRLSRYPKTQGAAGVAWRDELTADYDWFARADFIYTGNSWESDANLTRTGASKKVNLRLGVQSDALRFELYGRNVFHDKTFPVYQLLTDFAYFGQLVRLLTAPLPDKPVFGARVAYDF